MTAYYAICEQQCTEPSRDVTEWQNLTFLTLLDTDLDRTESDGEKLAKAIYDHPLKGSLTQ